MIVEDLILVDTKTQDRHLCKIREKNGNFILKIYVIGHFKNTTLTNNTKYELRENIRKN